MKTFSSILLLLHLFGSTSLAQAVRVNEVLSSNSSSFVDEDGEAVDWIELWNESADTVRLQGFGLTDNPSSPFKWTLPLVEIAPDAYTVIFASGKDRPGLLGRWETVVARGDTFQFVPGTTLISDQWIEPGFDDSGWSTGPAGIGYGDEDDATNTGTVESLFARTSFVVDDTSAVVGAVFHIDYDDAFIAYLNGVEIGRSDIGTPGVRVPATQRPPREHEAQLYQGLPITGTQVPTSLLVPGNNVLAVQVQNINASSSDLSMIPFFTIGLDQTFSDISAVNAEIQNDFEKELHTSFKISSDETVCLTSPDLTIQDCLPLQDVPSNTSVGLLDDGSVGVFTIPTPGRRNGSGESGIADAVVFSSPSGRYSGNVTVSIAASAGGQIVYTLDGSEPTASSAQYAGPIVMSETTVLRSRLLADGLLPGPIQTSTYFIGVEHTLPIVSIVTEPDLLFHPTTGLYVKGPNAESSFPYFGANFWEDREVPVYFDFIETDGSSAVAQTVGMKIYGGWSRGNPQKSVSLFARGRYGNSSLKHRFFEERAYDEYQSLILRNSGNDWSRSMLRDGFMQTLVSETQIDILSYRPTVVYINGEYWGLHNLREKVNEHYVQAISGADPDAIDLLEFNNDFGGASALHGTTEAWNAVIARVSMQDISSAAAYADVKTMVDIDNFIDYQIAEIFFDNRDWPGNNNKAWRSRTDDGRFRWILYDTDFGWGIWNPRAWQDNTLQFAMEPAGPDWPNPPWSTKLFRSLLRNLNFRYDFLNRFADFLNVHFDDEQVIRVLDGMADRIEGELGRQSDRWGFSATAWRGEISNMRTYGRSRQASMLSHVQDFFRFTELSPVSVSVDGRGGRVFVNREAHRSAWSGDYFDGVPVPIAARPDPGYRFSHWTGSSEETERTLLVDPATNVSLTAHFVADPGDPSAIVINEIHYNPVGSSGEWLELVNVGATAISLVGWMVSDAADSTLLAGLTIESGAYVVLCEDIVSFQNVYGSTCHATIPFRLGNGGDRIVLHDASGITADSVAYGNTAPWPSAPDGNDRSLELTDPLSENSLALSWRSSSTPGGSPGRANVVSTDVEETDAPAEFEFSVYPNPFAGRASLALALTKPGEVLIQVFDVLGRRLNESRPGVLTSGLHRIDDVFPPSTPTGLLLVRVSIDGRPQGFVTAIHVR